MRRLLFILLLVIIPLAGIAQKSRVLSVFQMIESEKYEEAKEAIELAAWNDKTSRWHRTYYAKGLLCQRAFEKGFDKNETKKTNLYPDQLIVAYNAYERALQLDSRSKTTASITMNYYGLANLFQKVGERHFQRTDFIRALEAFEHALMISKSPLLTVQTDTNLVYNAAMAAYESGNWEKAIGYLTGLNDDAYSPNTALLLYSSHVQNGDSAQAEEVLLDSEDRYKSEQTIVMQLVDLLVGTGRMQQAIGTLDTAISRRPDVYQFPWTRGLVYQQGELYTEALESLKQAHTLAPEEVGICVDLGLCYYNISVDINESARYIRNNQEYNEARNQAQQQLAMAVEWMERASLMDPADRQINSRLNQLYQWLHKEL